MKITSSEIKIPKTDKLSSSYFETEFEKRDLNVIRWAIVNQDNETFTINFSYVEN